MKNLITLLTLFFLPHILSAQKHQFTIEECRTYALEYNKKIKIAEEHVLMLNSMGKAAKTQHLPKFSFNGGYIRTNRELSLLSENMFLPVVPQEAIVNGEISEEVFRNNPDLMRETFVTGELFGQPYPLKDEDGNYIFKNYTYLPKDELAFQYENVFLMNLGMTQPIYMGGKIRELNKMAAFGENLMESKKELTKTEIIVESDSRYWKVISLKEKVKLTQIYKNMLSNLINDLNNYYEEGIITNNDVLKAKVKYNEIDLKLLKATNGLKLAQMALNQTLGFPLDTIIELSDSIVGEFIVPDISNATESALENRPEIDLLENTIKLSESGEKIMRSRYLPNIGLTANYLFINPNPYDGLKNEFGGDWNVGVMVNIPIWHWNDRKHSVNVVKHKTKALEIQFDETRELISLEVQQSVFKYKESIKMVEMTKISLDQAQENLELTKDSFSEGVSKTTDLLEAQTMWQNAYSDFIEAKTEQKLCETELLKASGQLNY